MAARFTPEPEAIMRHVTRFTFVCIVAALALSAPAAQARPAVDVGQRGAGVKQPAVAPPAAGAKLTSGQLHRIDGAAAVGSPAPRTAPSSVAPIESPLETGTDPAPWIFVAIPLGLLLALGGARKATHRTLLPHRGPRIAA
jgi:hypothetical protein